MPLIKEVFSKPLIKEVFSMLLIKEAFSKPLIKSTTPTSCAAVTTTCGSDEPDRCRDRP